MERLYGKPLLNQEDIHKRVRELWHQIAADYEGKDLLMVDDIIDSGVTTDFMKRHLLSKRPGSLKTCVLLDKKERRKVAIEADYAGFAIPNKYVVGYGLDYQNKYRNLPYIAVLDVNEA